MRRIIIISVAISLTLLSCDGQTKNKSDNQAKSPAPQTNINVKKEYDKNGNIVKFDSTYSSYYSNIKGDTAMRDSIFNKFKNQFNKSYSFSNEPYFKDFFFADSLLKYDFYKKDFFYNRFRNNMQKMDSLFRGMDIMKNDFYSKQSKSSKNEK
jgi:hypothetical protein